MKFLKIIFKGDVFMIDDFDRKLFEMARESKVKEPNALKYKVDYTFKKLKKNKFNFRHLGSIAAILICCILTARR